MAGDLLPEDLLRSLAAGEMAPYYLFFGASEFRLERALERIRNEFIP